MAPPPPAAAPIVGVEYGKVRAPLDQKAVDDYLSKHIPGFTTPCDIQQFSFGQSNPTYFITTPTGTRYVLRKKPAGKLVSHTAHAVEREFQILDAVHKAGTVPVPAVYALCTDESVLGTPFYVMEYLQGRIFTDVRMPEVESQEERTACWMSIIKTLAALHKLKPAEIGLANFGSTKPFYPRQIRSLTKVSQAQAAVRDSKTNEPVGEIPGFDFLVDWYARNAPDGEEWEGGIVHGDFKCDNMIFHPTKPEVIGVLDWELATLGHPLSDLANLLQPFYVPASDDENNPSHLTPLRDIPERDLPIPSARVLMQAYCDGTGMQYPIPRWGAACSFAFFRLAVITQGIAARAARGQASSARASTYAKIFPSLGALALESIERDTGGEALRWLGGESGG